MKIAAMLFVFLLASCSAHKMPDRAGNTERLIVSYSKESKSEILADVIKNGIPVVYDLQNMNIIVLNIPEEDAGKEIKHLESMKGVLSVQKDDAMVILQ
ncbi:hypothetical protein [Citrobacter sp. JGM124]|uniref:hypothetical protein n=1 Tax=Citrobacter sp. JGM124 TaxID=2799789 RepID=UPI001BA58E7D|nr:hypothetical protein [Citrobacter sp. JGM124]MBS0847397.1 hypothetical protein [Citrobacter sp. JGM124]